MQASLDHYDKAQRTIFCKMTAIAQTPKALNIECDIGVTSLRPTFLCLQCPAICTSQERGYHQTSKGHMFGSQSNYLLINIQLTPLKAVESSSGCLYCHLCQDFIYDPRFEELRAKKGSSPTSSKHLSIYSFRRLLIYLTREQETQAE